MRGIIFREPSKSTNSHPTEPHPNSNSARTFLNFSVSAARHPGCPTLPPEGPQWGEWWVSRDFAAGGESGGLWVPLGAGTGVWGRSDFGRRRGGVGWAVASGVLGIFSDCRWKGVGWRQPCTHENFLNWTDGSVATDADGEIIIISGSRLQQRPFNNGYMGSRSQSQCRHLCFLVGEMHSTLLQTCNDQKGVFYTLNGNHQRRVPLARPLNGLVIR